MGVLCRVVGCYYPSVVLGIVEILSVMSDFGGSARLESLYVLIWQGVMRFVRSDGGVSQV